jgi:hypothetical protein
MNVINAVAEFERDLLIERTQAGLSRAKAKGKRFGQTSEPDDGAAKGGCYGGRDPSLRAGGVLPTGEKCNATLPRGGRPIGA